jgi:hypothetical protein
MRKTNSLILGAFLLIGVASCQGSGGPEMVNVPEGTTVKVVLEQPLSTGSSNSGDSFTAKALEPIQVDGNTIIPAGTIVNGTLQDVEQPGRVKGRAQMTLNFDAIQILDGNDYPITTQPITLKAESGTEGDIEKIAAGALAGAIIGGLAKGGKGAAVGAIVGAGAGGVIVVATKGDNIQLEKGQKFLIQLTQSAELPNMAPEQH